MIEPGTRRSFIIGLVALVAAPAIVRAGSLMPVNNKLVPDPHDHLLKELTERYLRNLDHEAELLAHRIADSVLMQGEQWDNSPGFIERVNAAHRKQFPKDNVKIGDVLRIRLPNDWTVVSDPRTQLLSLYEPKTVPPIPDSLALAVAAVAIAPVVLAKPVTRRFWGK